MFTLTRDTSLPPDEVWRRVAALREHTETVPLTTTFADDGEPHVGWGFLVRTSVGPVDFDDSMVVEVWDPPHVWRVRKTGVLAGWAEARVSPYAGGSRLEWTEEIWIRPGLLRAPSRWIGDLTGPLLFGRVVDRLLEAPA